MTPLPPPTILFWNGSLAVVGIVLGKGNLLTEALFKRSRKEKFDLQCSGIVALISCYKLETCPASLGVRFLYYEVQFICTNI